MHPAVTSPSLLDIAVASRGACSIIFKGFSNCYSEHSLPHTFQLPKTEQRCPLPSFHLILLNYKDNVSETDVNREITSPGLCCSVRLPVQFLSRLGNLLFLELLAILFFNSKFI